MIHLNIFEELNNSITLVEWPEIILDSLQNYNYFSINFDTLDENVNHIWSAHSPIKECPKCQTILQYREFSFVHSKQHMMIYECDDCGYLGESWKVLPDPYN